MERRVLQSGIVRTRTGRGFTLVELAIVVAIVGILAVIAMVGYRKYLQQSKISEGQGGLSAIRIAQEDYRAEKGTYAHLGGTYCPTNAGAYDHKVGWNPACTGGSATWNTLPVHMSGAVQFKYATVAPGGTFEKTALAEAAWVEWGTPPAGPWYVAAAICDLDGKSGSNTELVTSSFSNQIFSRNEGD